MKKINILRKLAPIVKKPFAILLPISLFFAGWWFALPAEKHDHDKMAVAESNEEWTCSMHPQIRQPNFGLCPICNMDLILLEAGDSGGGLREVSISPEAAALLDLRVSPVLRAPATMDVKLFGKIDYDERSVVTTTARMSGRIDRLFADFTGTTVSKGDAIAEIYSPELFVAQQELIQASKNAGSSTNPAVRKIQNSLLIAAREKLRLLELTDEQIKAIEKQQKPSDHITLTAQQDGIIINLNAKEGQYLKTGEPLFSIAQLSTVWLKMEAYESDLAWLRYAQDVSFAVEAIPGKTFHGRIAFIDPTLDPQRRIVKIRVNVNNASNLLKPGMFVTAHAKANVALNGKVLSADLAGKWISPMHPEIIKDKPGKCDICGMPLIKAEDYGFIAPNESVQNPLLVPTSSVLSTGERAVVYVRIPDKNEPVFEGREIVLGPKAGDFYIVKNGLAEGELVVTKGAYKLDSELQIKARPSMMNQNAGIEEFSAKKPSDQIAGQWSPVLRAYGKLQASVQNNDTKAAEADLTAMQYALKLIHKDQLLPEELAIWNEFSMRLDNTLTIAKSKLIDRSAFTIIRQQVEKMRTYVGLPSEPIAPVLVDKKWIAPLKSSTKAYLSISEALANDKPDEAVKLIPALAKSLADLPETAETTASKKAVAELQKQTDIKKLRADFKPVSDSLIQLIRLHGIDQLGNTYVIHCPMALKGKGADWLSPDAQVRNPYFGDSMYDCGSVTDTLSLSAPANNK